MIADSRHVSSTVLLRAFHVSARVKLYIKIVSQTSSVIWGVVDWVTRFMKVGEVQENQVMAVEKNALGKM